MEPDMRKSFAVFSLLLAILAVRPAYATTDCNAASYTYFAYVDYSPEQLWEQKSTWDCWSLTGVSPTTMVYYSTPGFEVTSNSATATRVFTVSAGGTYEVSVAIEMIDPHHSTLNILYATALLYHPGTGTTAYDMYWHNGSQGDTSGTSYNSGTFTAAAGDTITVYIAGGTSGDSDSHTRFSVVHIFHDL
jgi:hypothetical protein